MQFRGNKRLEMLQKVRLNTLDLDLATKLKRKELHDRYPTADPNILDSMFVAHK